MFEVKFTWHYMGGVSLAIMQSIHGNQFYLTVIFTLGLKIMDQKTLEFLHKSHFFKLCCFHGKN